MPAETLAGLRFDPVTAGDLPMLAGWLDRPHWREWWGDPAQELGYIRDMIEGRDDTRPFVFSARGVPLGYIQVWRIASNRIEPWLTEAPWLAWLPDEALGVDLSLADPGMLSRGVGSAVLAAFVASLRAEGAREIVIDPDPANLRAVRAYEKAGFREIEAFRGRTGDCLLMRHHGEE
ncbi:MAG: GNAT family N-acetyltransferase [Paracoccaceae bacterium]